VLPLINIVFLLLVFFMVAGRLSATDPFEIVPTRSASEGAPAAGPILIAVGAGGELAVNGERIAEEALPRTIATGGEIRIKSDGRVPAARVVALLEQLRASGVGDVRLMTVPASDP